MLTSKVVWSVAVGHLASNWAVYQMNQLLPTYLNDVLDFDIKANGLVSAAPFIVQSVMTFIGKFCSKVKFSCDFDDIRISRQKLVTKFLVNGAF